MQNIERGCRPSVLKLEDCDVGMTIEAVQRDLSLIDITKLSENENPFGMSPRAMEAAVAELPGWRDHAGAGEVRVAALPDRPPTDE